MAKKSRKPAAKGSSRRPGASAPNRRAELHQQQLAEAQVFRRRRILVVVVTLVVVALAITVVAFGVARTQRRAHEATTTGDPSAQITPSSATEDGLGIVMYPDQVAAGAPEVDVMMDFQCPNCASYETTYGHVLNTLAQQGEIRLRYRIRTFLDINLQNDSSSRAAIAATCADTVGFFPAYSEVVFQNQPEEGVGYTDDQLSDTFAKAAGISGDDLTKLQSCYASRATSTFVTNLEAANEETGLNSTPTYLVNGNQFQIAGTTATTEAVLAAIQAAA